MNKDVVYVDVDEEITGIINKVKSSPEKIVALVLPKRASVLQSVVNMKLLHRAGEEAKKRVVLITSEANLYPLAATAGIYVAKSLQSKPEVPILPDAAAVEADDMVEEVLDDGLLDKSKPVGELAGTATAADFDEIDMNDEAQPSDVGQSTKATKTPAVAAATAATANTVKPNKKLKVPNFEKFRTRLILGVVVLLLLVGLLLWAFLVAPKALVTIKTDATPVQASLNATADPDADELDADDNTLPARQEEIRKTDTQKAPATGQKDVGTKASGQVTFSTSCSARAQTIAAGTGISNGNLTFITQREVTLNPSINNGNCTFSGTAEVLSQQNGEQYNLSSGKTFTVSGYANVSATNRDSLGGGTSRIVKIVSAQDVETAKQKITNQDSGIKDEIARNLEKDDYQIIDETFAKAEPKITVSPKAGDEAGEVSVTSETTFTLSGVRKDDLKTVVENAIKKQINTDQQQILDNGLSNADIAVASKDRDGTARLSIKVTASAGSNIDKDALKRELAGKKKGEIQSALQNRPGVRDVTVDYSPFWVYKTPKNPDKVTINLESGNGAN